MIKLLYDIIWRSHYIHITISNETLLSQWYSHPTPDTLTYHHYHSNNDRIGWCWIVNLPSDLIINDNTSPQVPWSASFWFWWSFYGWMVAGLTVAVIWLVMANVSFHRSDGVTKESKRRFNVVYSRFICYAPVMVSRPFGLITYILPTTIITDFNLTQTSSIHLLLILLFLFLVTFSLSPGRWLARIFHLRFPMVSQ